MGYFSEGETIRAFCSNCRKHVNSTYVQRTLPIENGLGLIRNALLLVCNECDEVIAIPAQSEDAIKSAIDKVNCGTKNSQKYKTQSSSKKSGVYKNFVEEKYNPIQLNLASREIANLKIVVTPVK